MRRVRADAEPCVGVSGVYGCVYREPATTTWEAPPPPAPPPPPAEHHAQATANLHRRKRSTRPAPRAPTATDHYKGTAEHRRAPLSAAEHR